MVALQYCRVIVQDGQLTSCVTQEAVGTAGVIHIMDSCSYQGCYLIYGVQTLLLREGENHTINMPLSNKCNYYHIFYLHIQYCEIYCATVEQGPFSVHTMTISMVTALRSQVTMML